VGALFERRLFSPKEGDHKGRPYRIDITLGVAGSPLLDVIPANYWLKRPQQADLIDAREYGSVANIARSMNISKNPPIMSAMAWKAPAFLFSRRALDQARM
jgi:hypothetical protein